MNPRRRPPLLLLLVLLGAGLVACDRGEAGIEAAHDTAAAADSALEDEPASRAEAERSPASVDEGDPFAGFSVDAGPGAPGPERRLPLRLLNHSDAPAIVYADGGAGEVVLDTIEPGVEARIDVLTRSPALTLRSLAPGGREMETARVEAPLDSVLDIVVGRPSPTP